MNRLMCCLFFILTFSCNLSFSNYVPVYVWGDMSGLQSFPSLSAFDKLSSAEFKEKYLSPMAKEKQIMLFLQDRLSSEDMSTIGGIEPELAFSNLRKEFNEKPSIILPNVYKPSSEIQNLKSSGIEIMEVDANDVQSNGIDIADSKPKIIVVYLYPTSGDRYKALKKNDKAMADILKQLGNSKVVAMYTGMKPIVEPDPEFEALSRHVRAADDVVLTDVPIESDGFLNYTFNGTDIFYAYGANATITILSNRDSIHEAERLVWPPKITQSPEPEIINGSISLNWEFAQFNRSGNLTYIALKLTFSDNTPSRYWSTTNVSLSYKLESSEGEEVYELTSPYSVGASEGFSFSCQNVSFSYSYANESAKDIAIMFKIERFQVEFNPKKSKFSESFDCHTFFTIPLWMGLFVTILFTFILAVGVFMLFEVKTMDRFDDPKGKTISVPLTD